MMFGNNDNDNNNDSPANPAMNAVVGGSGDSGDTPAAPPVADNPAPTAPAPGGDDSLVDIKQNALRQLTPLIGHLNQTPEEKFRTTMMMIQASDNQGLVKDAYDAAQAITDDKTRAQALLDIVNEINYFTQQQK